MGVVVENDHPPCWILDAIRAIQAEPNAQIVQVLTTGDGRGGAPRERLPERLAHLAYDGFRALDTRLFRRPQDAFEPGDLETLLPACPHRQVAATRRDDGLWLGESERAAIDGLHLDVVVDFGAPSLRTSSGALARLGAWSYRHGSMPRFADAPPGFRELIADRACLYSALVSDLGPESATRLQYSSWSAVDYRSPYRTMNDCLTKLAQFPARALRAVDGSSGPAAAAESTQEALIPECRHPSAPPGNLEVCKGAAILAARLARDRLRALVEDNTWFLACGFGLDPLRPRPDRLLTPPPGRFWADPFPIAADDGYWIFFEEGPLAVQRGRLSVMHMDRSGRCEAPVVVLEEATHVSYPCVFRAGKETWMVPESKATRSVRMFRARRFPFAWEEEAVLLHDVDACDSTLAEIDGRWWMFANVAPAHGSTWDELHLYYADRPQGPWTAHPRNPVVSDVRSARPAGHLFEHAGRWYRPAQDLGPGYGSAVAIQRIERIDPQDYSEVEVTRILPDWNRRMLGVHTLNRAGDLTVMDGLYRAPRFRKAATALKLSGRE
ncbi:MAG TPA: hypothetical protein VJV75_04245 [Candidatus Polarisedimenticolia bacterium]|nr:hypothetical protein [Candidatus Polarisedimenticolia bacterium]